MSKAAVNGSNGSSREGCSQKFTMYDDPSQVRGSSTHSTSCPTEIVVVVVAPLAAPPPPPPSVHVAAEAVSAVMHARRDVARRNIGCTCASSPDVAFATCRLSSLRLLGSLSWRWKPCRPRTRDGRASESPPRRRSRPRGDARPSSIGIAPRNCRFLSEDRL